MRAAVALLILCGCPLPTQVPGTSGDTGGPSCDETTMQFCPCSTPGAYADHLVCGRNGLWNPTCTDGKCPLGTECLGDGMGETKQCGSPCVVGTIPDPCPDGMGCGPIEQWGFCGAP